MNAQVLHQVIDQFQTTFRAWFPSVTDQDLATILTGPSESLLTVLQRRCGFTCSQAKGAWNQFVLCVVDGQAAAPSEWQPCGAPLPAMQMRFGRSAVSAEDYRRAEARIESRLA